jgi:methylated-DNA-protein-cysteine methyltransferase-like protein
MMSAEGTYWLIWQAVKDVPRGKVATYGEIARLAGFPQKARFVGYALHALPPGSGIPWHRVVNARGEISLGGTSARLQKRLLQKEGVRFVSGRIDLRHYGWPREIKPPRK